MTLTKEQLYTIISRVDDADVVERVINDEACSVYENLSDYIEESCELEGVKIPDWISVNETETYIQNLRFDDMNRIAFVNAVDNPPNEFINKEEWYDYIHNLCCTSPVVVYRVW